MTINGRDVSEFFSLLQENLDTKEEQGKTYVDIDTIRKRVGELCPPWNYNFEVIQPPHMLKVLENYSVCVIGRLTILSDEGNVICVRQCPGGCDIGFLTNKPDRTSTEIKTALATASTEAFKKCWQELGLGAQEAKFSTKKSSAAAQTFEIEFTSDIVKKGASLLTADVTLVATGEKRQLCIMQKGLTNLANKYNKTTEECISLLQEYYGVSKKGKRISCTGTLSQYNGVNQLLLLEIV